MLIKFLDGTSREIAILRGAARTCARRGGELLMVTYTLFAFGAAIAAALIVIRHPKDWS